MCDYPHKLKTETVIRALFVVLYLGVTPFVWFCWKPGEFVKHSICAMIIGFAVYCIRVILVKWESRDCKGVPKLLRAFIINYPATLFFSFCIFFPIVYLMVESFPHPYDVLFCCGVFSALGWHIDVLYSDGNIFAGISKIIRTIKGKPGD